MNARRTWTLNDLAEKPSEYALAEKMLDAYFSGRIDHDTFTRFDGDMSRSLFGGVA